VRLPALTIAVFAAVAPCQQGQQSQDAAAVTQPGRTLARPLELFLGTREVRERTLLILLDATPAVQAAGFADALATALEEQSAMLARTKLGLGVVGHRGTVALAPSSDHAAVLAEVRARLQQPSGEIQNVYASLREAAAALGGGTSERELLLVTFDNGDAEDDVEQTLTALRRAKVKLIALTNEAYVADSYWAARPHHQAPKGTTLTGGDGPVIDLPWGWLFQVATANEITPAAVGPYALSRLAAETGGRVHLYAAPNQTGHVCAIYSACLFCSGDHLPRDEAYWEQRVARLTPPTIARREMLVKLGRDVYFRALLHAWKRAADEGLVRSEPSVRLQGATATVDRQRFANPFDLSGVAFDRHQKQAERAAAAAGEIGTWLENELQRLGADRGLARQEAGAHLTRLFLQLARVNLISFAAWCRDVAPGLMAGETALAPPEVAQGPADQRAVGIGITNLCLCHGVRPFYEVELPGGPALRQELEKLDVLASAFLARYGHTQYAYALHRAGIARFHLTYPGIAGAQPRVRPKSDADTNPTTTPRFTRPDRGGSSASPGGASGPTTGGR
jgi:hypothetical protein